MEVARATQGLEILVIVRPALGAGEDMVNMQEAVVGRLPEAHDTVVAITLKDAPSLTRSYIWHVPSVPQVLDKVLAWVYLERSESEEGGTERKRQGRG